MESITVMIRKRSRKLGFDGVSEAVALIFG